MSNLLLITQVGDMAPWGDGPQSSKIEADPGFHDDVAGGSFPGDYLRNNFPAIDFFQSCTVE